MALILAIEPDHRQAGQLAGIVRHRLNAELLLAETTERALDAIGDRIPDLVLIPALLSPQDDAALAAALRVIAAAANVRTLTIPVFASAAPRETSRGVLGRWRRAPASPAPDGCDPAVFAEQVSTYLAEAIAERAALEPEPLLEQPVIESTHISTDFVVAYQAPPEPITYAMSPPAALDAAAVVEVPGVFTVPAADESAAFEMPAAFLDRYRENVAAEHTATAAPEPAADAAALFETADVIEVDLSDATLEHALDDAVFEIGLDDDTPELALEAPPLVSQAPMAAAVFADDDRVPVARATDVELWMPLPAGVRLWPAIEGIVSEYVDHAAEMFGPPQAAKPEHPEWTELIASLRQDMERRREAVEPTSITRATSRRKSRPVQDEWGFFDPQQCGFAALLAKLDEITDANEEPASRLA